MSDGLAFNNQTENTVFGIDQHTEVQLLNFKLIYPIKVQNFKKKQITLNNIKQQKFHK